MRGIDFFLISYTALAFSSTIFLSLIGVSAIDVYLALLAIEFFVATELGPKFGQAESRRLAIMASVLMAMFALIVVGRLVQILQ